MKVTAFTDIANPWCYIDITRFERAAAAYTLQTGTPVEIALRTYQLDPSAPSQHRPLLEAMGDGLGGREGALEVAVQVAEAGRPDGLSFDFESAVQANSFDAHRLLTWAEASGGLGAQRDLAHELWRAHFAEGADIADHVTLAARAAAVGLDADGADSWLASDDGADQVRLQVEMAASLGVPPQPAAAPTKVPTFVVEAKYAISGSQPYETYAEVLKEVARDLSES